MWSSQICLFLGLKKLLTINLKENVFVFQKVEKSLDDAAIGEIRIGGSSG
jgi:hypothetical protein